MFLNAIDSVLNKFRADGPKLDTASRSSVRKNYEVENTLPSIFYTAQVIHASALRLTGRDRVEFICSDS